MLQSFEKFHAIVSKNRNKIAVLRKWESTEMSIGAIKGRKDTLEFIDAVQQAIKDDGCYDEVTIKTADNWQCDHQIEFHCEVEQDGEKSQMAFQLDLAFIY